MPASQNNTQHGCQRSNSLCRVQRRTPDRLTERTTRELYKVADALVQRDHAKSRKNKQGVDERGGVNQAKYGQRRTFRRASWYLLDRAYHPL